MNEKEWSYCSSVTLETFWLAMFVVDILLYKVTFFKINSTGLLKGMRNLWIIGNFVVLRSGCFLRVKLKAGVRRRREYRPRVS